jgi:hypothetical protein
MSPVRRIFAAVILLALLSAVAAPLYAGPCCAAKCCKTTKCSIAKGAKAAPAEAPVPQTFRTAVAYAIALELPFEGRGGCHRSPAPQFAGPPLLQRNSPLLI